MSTDPCAGAVDFVLIFFFPAWPIFGWSETETAAVAAPQKIDTWSNILHVDVTVVVIVFICSFNFVTL